mgnify:FL=1
MALKTNGAEFKRFYNDAAFWPEGAWHEDEDIEVNGSPLSEDSGIEEVPDDAVVKIAGGAVIGLPGCENGGPSFEGYFKKWRRVQNTASFVVECDKANLDALKVAIRAAGGKVV